MIQSNEIGENKTTPLGFALPVHDNFLAVPERSLPFTTTCIPS